MATCIALQLGNTLQVPKLPGSVPKNNRLPNVLLIPGERYPTLSILTHAFSLFFLTINR
jgi:hypothetical protein